MASLTWLQCSTGETQLFQYFNKVFLEMLNVPLRTVFADPVTIMCTCTISHVISMACILNSTQWLDVKRLCIPPPPSVITYETYHLSLMTNIVCFVHSIYML